MRMNSYARSRRGIATVLVLGLFAVVLTLLLSAMSLSIMHRRQLSVEQRRIQAEFLLAAAKERAVAQLKSDQTYQGEAWEIPASELDGQAAAIKIAIASPAGKARQLSVQVAYPVGSPAPISRSATYEILQ